VSQTKHNESELGSGSFGAAAKHKWSAALPPTHHSTNPRELVLGAKDAPPLPDRLHVRTNEQGGLYLEVQT
jgi:hypothetical protein